MESPFEASVKQLIRKMIYMFYDGEKIMVMECVLRNNNIPQTMEEIQEIVHLRKKDLDDAVGILKRDGMLSVHEEIDMTGWDPKKKMSELAKKKKTRYYYAIDYKVLFDSARLKIHLARKELQDLCGKDDNISYRCENCERTFKLVDLVTFTSDGTLFCPDCEGKLHELDIDDKVNEDKKRYQEFYDITQPLLEQIRTLVRGKVFEDKWDYRIKADRLMDVVQYNLKQRKKEEHEMDRRLGYFTPGHTQADLNKQTTVIIAQKVEKKEVDEETKSILKDLNKEKEEPQEDHEIELSGKIYKLSEINDETFINWEGTDEDLEKLNEFYLKYKQ